MARFNIDNASDRGDFSVVLMPESEHNTLCLALQGTVKYEDYAAIFRGQIEETLRENDNFNILIYYSPAFQGWERDAADMSLQTIIDYGSKIHKLAHVNPPEKRVLMQKLAPTLFSGESKNFTGEELDSALNWIKS